MLGKSYRELLASMDAVELAEWEAVNRLWPIDLPRRQELSSAITSMLIHNSSGAPAKSAGEFMRDWGEQYQPTALDPQTVADKVDAISLALVGLASQGAT